MTRPLVAADLHEVLALNQANTPHVGDLDAERLSSIVGECSLALVAPVFREHGAVIVLLEPAPRPSRRLRWRTPR